MSVHLYFTIKKSNVPKGELEKVLPASMVESVKSELQCTEGIKYTTDEEGSSTNSEEKRHLNQSSYSTEG